MASGILGKGANRLSSFLYYQAKPGFLNPINFMRVLNRRRSEKLIRQVDGGKLYGLINKTMEASPSTGCDYSDYWMIYSTLVRVRPKCVLECGSGVSSVVFAYYAASVAGSEHETQIISVEENLHYHESIIAIFPDELSSNITFMQRDRVEARYGTQQGCYYRDLPDLKFDFIFIDGPTDRRVWSDKSFPKCFNADFLNIVRKSDHPVSALLDQRIFTLRALRSLISGDRITYLPTRAMAFISGVTRRDLVEVEILELD